MEREANYAAVGAFVLLIIAMAVASTAKTMETFIGKLEISCHTYTSETLY